MQRANSTSGSPSKATRGAEQRAQQRGFTVSQRAPIHGKHDPDMPCPGNYDTHLVGEMSWAREGGGAPLSHPAQRQLSQHKSPHLTSFARPKYGADTSASKLSQLPGPGHYAKPDYWDPGWQRFPSAGKSFDRKVAPLGESRFGGLAKKFEKGVAAKGTVVFLGS